MLNHPGASQLGGYDGSQVNLRLKCGMAVHDDCIPTKVSASVGAERGPTPCPRCLSDDEIISYADGETSEAQRQDIESHLDDCASCRELVHFLVRDDEPVEEPSLDVTTFAPGDVLIGRYSIDRFVGKGGMGEVYQSFDRLLCKPVALKTLLCSMSDSPRAVRKLFDEVRNAQRVAHRHVCRIYELHEHEDAARFSRAVPFFTMEHIDGERLACRIRREALSVFEVRTIAVQLLQGLDAAHSQGVLHLDFKSDNVLLRRSKLPVDAVIMDFGLSRAFDTPSSVRTSERLQCAGTLPYMALEQLECRVDVGPSADVYAFGVVLYEMLTRRLPFEGATPSAMLLKQLAARPTAPSRLRPGLSTAVDAFVLRCLDVQPKSRFADAGAALAALERIQFEAVAPAPPPLRRRTAGWVLGLSVPIASALAIGIAAHPWRHVEPPSHGDSTSTATAPSPAGAMRPFAPTPVQNAAGPRSLERPPSAPSAAATPSGALSTNARAAETPASIAAAPSRAFMRSPDRRARSRSEPAAAPAPRDQPTWIPRHVPSGGFWHPPAPSEPDGAGRMNGAKTGPRSAR